MKMIPSFKDYIKKTDKELDVIADSVIIRKNDNAQIFIDLILLTRDEKDLCMSWEIDEKSSIPRDILSKVYVYNKYEVSFNKW